ncbi:hypothetical protein NM208_g11505 [Fusarium decemcellulare]|uniref:Uncharacterized protein n=1 Tax=Fusarium decemcellulare TaxID=57161 RepID=A0ACC1RTU6_9HYPO|nr:hypothetical protein NM208_g11505 [Fusarium decemcellulare]
MTYPQNNRTWQIIHEARKGGYAVGGFCVYNTEGVLAVVKAAERCRSPALIQFFPWSMHFQGPAFIKYAAEVAHSASVPIAIHLDHCLKPEDADLALECAFDSIMVDGSMFDEMENVRYVKSVVDRAKEKGITVEAELGRMEGGEDGLPTIDLESVWTDPQSAADFVKQTGVHFLAPSFGNVHGPYPHGGAEKHWQIERLEKIHSALGEETPLVLHGTHPLSDDMVRVAMARGMVKVNQNRNVREGYHRQGSDIHPQLASNTALHFPLDIGPAAHRVNGFEAETRECCHRFLPMDNSRVTMSRSTPPAKKKYVTRACDACKKRKSKCDGLEPCARCLNSDIECAYNSSYNRVQRNNTLRQRHRFRSEAQTEQPSTRAEDLSESAAPKPIAAGHSLEDSNSDGKEDDDSGDASVHAFLRRVSRHLAQVGQGLPRNLFKQEQDTPKVGDTTRTLLLPDKQVAQGYVDCYFEHANVTYRYVPRAELCEVLKLAYAEDDAVLQDDIRMAMLLLVMGMGCIWTASWKNQPLPPWRTKAQKFLQASEIRLDKVQGIFPPPLGVLQAQLLKCQLELASSRYNSAWVTLGLVVRLGQMIDFQREPASGDNVQAHYKRCTFWATFMIDRYLAASLGRPMAIHESDITISFPSKPEPNVAAKLGLNETKLQAGVVAHARLAQIIGHIITRLYRGVNHPSTSSEKTVAELETEIKQWLQETPDFFHPQPQKQRMAVEQTFYDVPWIFRRQQKTVQAAFHFANMLIYRGTLLQEFLHQAPSTPRPGPSSERVQACVDSALAMVILASDFGVDECKYNATFWTTSHFIFCAISILLVYLTLYRESDDRAVIESAVEEAMKVHRKLDYSDNIRTQKLLEESRSRTEIVRNMTSPASSAGASKENSQRLSRTDQITLQQVHAVDQQPTDEPLPASDFWHLQQPQHGSSGEEFFGNLELSLQAFGTVNDLGMIMDIGFDNVAFPDAFGTGNEDPF